jgi:hypothetical protein
MQLESDIWTSQQVLGQGWEDVITMNLKETELEEGREMDLAYDRVQRCNLDTISYFYYYNLIKWLVSKCTFKIFANSDIESQL